MQHCSLSALFSCIIYSFFKSTCSRRYTCVLLRNMHAWTHLNRSSAHCMCTCSRMPTSLTDMNLDGDSSMSVSCGNGKLRQWLIDQIDSGEYGGLVWENDEKSIFRIPWKHAGKQDYNRDEDAALFKVIEDEDEHHVSAVAPESIRTRSIKPSGFIQINTACFSSLTKLIKQYILCWKWRQKWFQTLVDNAVVIVLKHTCGSSVGHMCELDCIP